MGYQEFLRVLQKQGSKAYKISKCLGARDAWKWVRKNKWELLDKQQCSHTLYGAVVNEMNKILAEQLLEGHQIILPYQMGSLELVAKKERVSFKEGSLHTNYRTDWKKTLKYWYEDEEALREHKQIKRVQKYIYSIKYRKHSAKYKNQRHYMFRANRSLVRALGNKIENEKMNALIY